MRNIRYAIRSLLRSPGFALLAVGTFALGIGANAAIFSVVEAVLLKPLPYPHPDKLVSLWEARSGVNEFPMPGQGTIRPSVSLANVSDYNRQTSSFDGFATYTFTRRSLTGAGEPAVIFGETVSPNYLSILGMSPALGRSFDEVDRQAGRRVVILTDELWRVRFGASPAILGRQIQLDGEAHDVIGVMPPSFESMSSFRVPASIRFLVPIAQDDPLLASRGNSLASAIGRMRGGVTIEAAQSDLDVTSRALAQQFPRTNGDLRATIAPLGGEVTRNVRASLLLLLATAVIVLLVACANVASLLLLRAVGQRREIAIRMAVGASRRNILAEALTRGLVLGVIGGLAGLLVGVWTRDALLALAPATIPRLNLVSLDGPVLVFTMVLSVVSGLIAGLIPAVQASLQNAATLSEASLTLSASRAVVRWRSALVAVEIAAALILAIGATLLVRSLWLLNSVPLGYDTSHVLVMTAEPPPSRYPDARARLQFFDAVSERLRAIPGVRSVAYASEFPLSNSSWGADYFVERAPQLARGVAGFQAVSPDYFSTLGVPIVQGRPIDDHDREGAPMVAVISDTLASTIGGDPIGLMLDWNLADGQPRRGRYPALTIVGVAGQVRRQGHLSEAEPQVYLAVKQIDLPRPSAAQPNSMAVRTDGDPRRLAREVRRALWAVDSDQAIAGVQTLDELLSRRVADRRFNLALIAAFAGLALVLALVGVYGVTAFAAAERTREIGIRLAFGATAGDVMRLVIKSASVWSVIGVAAGLIGALALTRFLRGMLFGIGPTDPVALLATAALVLFVALVASYLPARRASMIDPVNALRVE